ncbi:glutamyl-tRNA synthetase [Nematocida sp. LUAm3]|nr:glutamyl-tRNA synthetase [Nematocida sp. LUAm3]KAI5174034.1 glutamyl-tRNA synthetase [Nematocida sp. LUAm2]KAI5177223.1 glutamyl-tRNA synthetase [Nematocida sp. LUAm1]
MVTVQCSYTHRTHMIAYLVSKSFSGIEMERVAKKNSEGFCNFASLQEFLSLIPKWDYKEKMSFLSEWKYHMTYSELQEALKEIEQIDLQVFEEKEKVLLFSLLHVEIIFVNLYRAKKLSGYPKILKLYEEVLKKEEENLKEYDKIRKQENKASDQASFDIGLPDNYKVVTRFPPEPSGYLHIGHAKAALLNKYFADRYDGELIIRMDDTNPEKEKEEYEKSIMEDLSLLGITNYKTTRSSDHFESLLELAKKLIKKGLAYCDNTAVEEMRNNRDKGIPSVNRDALPEKNLLIFNGMISSSEYDEYCLRAKISVDNLNKAMRDPVIYRVCKIPHHYTGTKYRVYPTYDFACPVIDSVEGVTLALRTNEYRDRNPQYMWFISALDLQNRPVIWDFSRLNFKHTVLSKRKLKWFVENKKVSGWDDPRMPTVRGILRKGLCQEALKEYIISQGPSKNTVLLSWDKIWALNAQKIDPLAIRIHGIEKNDTQAISLTDIKTKTVSMEGKKDRTLTSNVFVSKKELGTVKVNDKIVLLGACTFKITGVSPITAISSSTPPRDIEKKLTWVSADHLVEATCVEYSDLITVEKPEDQEPHELFNEESKKEEVYICDERALQIKEKEFLQIEKRGFFYCDSHTPFIFNLVPGTKQNKK